LRIGNKRSTGGYTPTIRSAIARKGLTPFAWSIALAALSILVSCGGGPVPENGPTETSPTAEAVAAPVLPTAVPLAAVASAPETPVVAGDSNGVRAATATPEANPVVVPTVTVPESMSRLPNVADTVERARPAVVSVLAEVMVPGVFGPQTSGSSGTGVIFTREGLVLTNNHVIEGAVSVTVTMDGGRSLEAEFVGSDRLSDLAVLRLPPGEYAFLPVKDDIKLRAGDWVIAIGNALALPGGPTVTVGVISALGRSRDAIGGTTLNDLIQTDAVINPGNSGGPLISLEGDLVGINTAVLRSSGGRGIPIEGIGFAVNMETVAQVSAQLIELGRVRWAYMGLSLDDLSPELAAQAGLPFRQGAVVLGVGPGTPSDQAGFLRGDIILSLDGNEIANVRDLLLLLRQDLKAGQEVGVVVFRDGVNERLKIVLGERPPG
jgi:S1-C subfamily serine protease